MSFSIDWSPCREAHLQLHTNAVFLSCTSHTCAPPQSVINRQTVPIGGLDGSQLCSSSVVKLLTPTGRETKRGDLLRRKEEVNRVKIKNMIVSGGTGGERKQTAIKSRNSSSIYFCSKMADSSLKGKSVRIFVRRRYRKVEVFQRWQQNTNSVRRCVFSWAKGGEARWREIWGCWFWSRELMLRSLMDRVPGMRLPCSHKMDGAPLLFSPSYSLMSLTLFSSLFWR